MSTTFPRITWYPGGNLGLFLVELGMVASTLSYNGIIPEQDYAARA
jgi:hypothetical protein